MGVIRYQPISLLDSLQNEVNRLFDQTSDLSTSSASSWVPKVDIKEEADKFIVFADLPGVDPKDIKVSMENGALSIQGERKLEKRDEGKNFARIERMEGSFYRKFQLPMEIDQDKIVAKGKHGVLEITIPKVKQQKSKFIQVSVED